MSFATFASDIIVRPDDIDVNAHVHNSRYLDYVLMARYDQMARCYGMSMEEFLKLGYSWVNSATYIEYKRPLVMGDVAIVRTRVGEMREKGVRVEFEILRRATGKIVADGWQDYVMVSVANGRAIPIPEQIRTIYSIPANAAEDGTTTT
jgi:acyl-CoA thioester hydrolase/thioesterase-3